MTAEVIPLPVRRHTEPMLTKQQLALHYGFTTRWVELRTREGMPSTLIGGRRRYRISEVETWLQSR